MPSKPASGPDSYFSPDSETDRAALRAELGLAAQRLRDRHAIAAQLAVDDHDLIERIHALGFNGDSVRAFDLLPLVHVAWADGRIQRRERAAILDILEKRGVQPGSDAFVLMETLLESRPSETYLAESLAILRVLVRGEHASDIVALCRRVAEASGGLFGLGDRTSDAERALLEKVVSELGAEAKARFSESLDGEST